MEIGGRAIHRCVINFEVARVNYRSHWGPDDHPCGIWDAVIDPKKANREWTNIHFVARFERVQLGAERLASVLELDGHEADRQCRPINGYVEPRQDIRQRADVILMPMGQNDRLQLVTTLHQVARVRQNQVNPQHFAVRKHDPAVDCDDGVLVFEGHHVFADFAKSAERDDAEE